MNTEEHSIKIGRLREIIKDMPDDAKVYYHRIEDVYFEKHGWTTVPVPEGMHPGEFDQHIRAFSAFEYEGDLYITAHY